MLAKSHDQDIAIQGICELLLKDLPDCTRKSKGVDIEVFTEWVATTTAFNLTTHMTILQLHLRTKIIGKCTKSKSYIILFIVIANIIMIIIATDIVIIITFAIISSSLLPRSIHATHQLLHHSYLSSSSSLICIGESYWLRLTEDRSKDMEMQKVDFIPKIQHKLIIQKEEFRVKKEIVTRENARLERRGLGELFRMYVCMYICMYVCNN